MFTMKEMKAHIKEQLKISAPAKLNLTLDVMGKREDGFHELSTLMSTIDLFNEITFDFSYEDIAVECTVPLPQNSVAYKAAAEYKLRTGCGGAHIFIKANIPQMAGLGGSSADAAGVLRGMNARYGAMEQDELLRLGASLGSDVPFLIKGGIALCKGKGEIMQPLDPVELHTLVVKPENGVLTKELFARLKPPYGENCSQKAVAALSAGDNRGFLSCISNALEKQAVVMVPEIAQIKQQLLRLGAQAACMSGSGSAVFGIFQSEAAALKAKASFCGAAFKAYCKTYYNVI